MIDDDNLLRMDVSDIIAITAFRTFEVCDGDEAMAVLGQHHLDIALAFSDVEMPGSRNAFALARKVAVKWSYIAIVIASGRLVPAEGELPEGAHFIGKPFSAEAVHGHLREIMPDDGKPEPLRGRP